MSLCHYLCPTKTHTQTHTQTHTHTHTHITHTNTHNVPVYYNYTESYMPIMQFSFTNWAEYLMCIVRLAPMNFILYLKECMSRDNNVTSQGRKDNNDGTYHFIHMLLNHYYGSLNYIPSLSFEITDCEKTNFIVRSLLQFQ